MEVFYKKSIRKILRFFPVNFVKFLRTPFLQNTSGRLLLEKRKLLSGVVDVELLNNVCDVGDNEMVVETNR